MIEFKNVTKTYGDKTVLDDVSINIEPGEFVFLVGASGAGKSTFIKILTKEIQVTKGEIFLDKENVTNIHKADIPYYRRNIGNVFQDFRLLPKKTAYENVAYALEVTETPIKDIRKSVPLALSLVALSDKANNYPHQLSGGEQQRVSIARALANKPTVLIADEPTGNLDKITTLEIMRLLLHINRRGTTIIMATHDDYVVDLMKKRVIELSHGRIVRDSVGGFLNENK